MKTTEVPNCVIFKQAQHSTGYIFDHMFSAGKGFKTPKCLETDAKISVKKKEEENVELSCQRSLINVAQHTKTEVFLASRELAKALGTFFA